jgi:hypothetical protein
MARRILFLGFLVVFWDGALHGLNFFGLPDPWDAVLLFSGAALLGAVVPFSILPRKDAA